MRLWHKKLIHVLPRQQLLSQWRECCCIARNISVKGTPNHILVNKMLKYPLFHLFTYSMYIADEMIERGYKVDKSKFLKWVSGHDRKYITFGQMYNGWHNERYLLQCYFNL